MLVLKLVVISKATILTTLCFSTLLCTSREHRDGHYTQCTQGYVHVWLCVLCWFVVCVDVERWLLSRRLLLVDEFHYALATFKCFKNIVLYPPYMCIIQSIAVSQCCCSYYCCKYTNVITKNTVYGTVIIYCIGLTTFCGNSLFYFTRQCLAVYI